MIYIHSHMWYLSSSKNINYSHGIKLTARKDTQITLRQLYMCILAITICGIDLLLILFANMHAMKETCLLICGLCLS